MCKKSGGPLLWKAVDVRVVKSRENLKKRALVLRGVQDD